MKKGVFNFLCICTVIIAFASCKKDEPAIPLNDTKFSEITAEVDRNNIVSLSASVLTDKRLSEAELGFVIAEEKMPTAKNLKIKAKKSGSKITAIANDLKENTTYYVRVYVKLSETEYEYSQEISFTAIATTSFSDFNAEVDYEVIKLIASVITDSRLGEVESGFVIAEKSLPTVDDEKINAEIKDKTLTASIQNLKEKTVYYARVYVKKSATEYEYSPEISFTTLSLFDRAKVLVEGGKFYMGSSESAGGEDEGHVSRDEMPMHEVTIKSFEMDTKEVTYAQYADFLNNVKTEPRGLKVPKDITYWIYITDAKCGIAKQGETYVVKEGKENLPAGWIRWYGAEAYAKWVGGRLPSEAEREYAALGGQKSKNYTFAGSNNLDEVGWYRENSNEKVHPVGQKLPNELGLYDMSGNVGEWCVDSYHGEDVGYQGAPTDGSAWTEGGRGHIIRGGSFQSVKLDCRSKYRTYNAWYYCGDNVGFRVVYDIEEK